MFYCPECCVFGWMGAWEKYIFCLCSMKYSIDVKYTQLIDGIIEFNYVDTNFLPAVYVCFWESSVEVPNYDSGFIYFPLLFYQLLLHVVWHFLRYIWAKDYLAFLENWSFHHYVMFSLKTVLALKYVLSDINITTLGFFYLVLAWHIFLLYLILIYIYLYLKWISYRQHIAGL